MAFGRLERTPGPQPMSEINVTPLVDVMLVLVVIFIITAPLLASSIRLELPQAEGAQAGPVARFVVVAIDARGGIFIDDKAVAPEQLATQLAQVASRHADTELQLRGDQGVPYGRVVEVMAAAHQAGLRRIGFVAERR